MPETFHVVVTGASKGIGKALAINYLSRPNTTVIAAVRDLETSTKAYKDILRANKDSLILVKIDSLSESDAQDAASLLREKHNINKIDLLIANAGMGTAYDAAATTPHDSLTQHFRVNAGGPFALVPGLPPAPARRDGFGSQIRAAEQRDCESSADRVLPSEVDGVWCVKSRGELYCATNPRGGRVVDDVPHQPRTGMGDTAAKAVGLAQAPMTVDDSANGIIRVIDGATRSGSSGRFVGFNGEDIPW